MGMLEPGGKVHATVVPSRCMHVLHEEVRMHVAAGTALYTDALPSYNGLASEFQKFDSTLKRILVIDHQKT